MLVKELIQELKKFKPSEEIVFHCDIETGRSFSYCKEGDLSVSVEELDEELNGETFWSWKDLDGKKVWELINSCDLFGE